MVAEGWIVIFDFSNVTGLQMRLIGMQFVLAYILEFIKHRGPGRHKPISLIIDELLALFPQVGEGERQMEADIDALVNIYSRNYRLFTCVSLQSVSQVGERLQRTLLSMPTQIHGVATDADSAAILARAFSSYQPQSLKDVRPVWGTDVLGSYIQDYTPTFYSIEEQLELDAQVFRDLQPFGFLDRMPTQEGSVHGPINKISIAGLDAGLYADDQLMETSRPLFTRIPGHSIDEVNQESAANGPYGASPQISFPGDDGQVLKPDDRIPFFTD